MNALAIVDTTTLATTALGHSPSLLRVSEQMAALTRELYGRGPLRCTLGDTGWRFRWRHLTGSLSGVELRVRIGDVQTSIGLEDLRPFGSAIDITRPELPAILRVAYLSGIGVDLWTALETLMQRAVELEDVQLNRAMCLDSDCLGFELAHDPHGPATRGFVRAPHADLQRVLREASLREMDAAPVPESLPLQWAVVVGHTALSAGEARGLVPQDIVVIDDATYTDDALNCRLAVGSARREAGRVSLRLGYLHLVEFSISGNAPMTNSAADDASAREAGFEEIPVGLRFELTQWQAPLGQVAALAEGAVIDLGQRIDEQSVSVWVEQHCIGQGHLVAVGERLGVRLLRVFGSGTPRSPAVAEPGAVGQGG